MPTPDPQLPRNLEIADRADQFTDIDHLDARIDLANLVHALAFGSPQVHARAAQILGERLGRKALERQR